MLQKSKDSLNDCFKNVKILHELKWNGMDACLRCKHIHRTECGTFTAVYTFRLEVWFQTFNIYLPIRQTSSSAWHTI